MFLSELEEKIRAKAESLGLTVNPKGDDCGALTPDVKIHHERADVGYLLKVKVFGCVAQTLRPDYTAQVHYGSSDVRVVPMTEAVVIINNEMVSRAANRKQNAAEISAKQAEILALLD